MKNEVYGTIEIDVSMEIQSETSGLGVLEANYKVNSERFYKKCSLLLEDSKGNIHNIKINSINDVKWEKFFSEHE